LSSDEEDIKPEQKTTSSNMTKSLAPAPQPTKNDRFNDDDSDSHKSHKRKSELIESNDSDTTNEKHKKSKRKT